MRDQDHKRVKQVSRRRPHSFLLVGLLAFALVITGVLGWQAFEAERSHRSVAERALTDYARFAAWQLNQQAAQEMLSAMISTFILPLTRVDPANPSTWPSPEEFRAASLEPPAPAKYLQGVRFFFRMNLRDSSMTIGGEQPSDAVLQWVRKSVLNSPARFTVPPIQTQAFGSADRRPASKLGVIVSNDSYIAAVDSIAGRLRVVVFVISRDYDSKPLVSYGFETDARNFIDPLIDSVLVRTPLLPPSLVHGVPRDSVLAVRAWAAQSDTVYRSTAPWFSNEFRVVDTLDERFSKLRVAVSLRPDIAPKLVVGGLPRSRLPVLIGLFALTAGLLAAAIIQLRRQQQLAQLRVARLAPPGAVDEGVRLHERHIQRRRHPARERRLARAADPLEDDPPAHGRRSYPRGSRRRYVFVTRVP